MFCTNCGAKNPEQANFCFACGRPLFTPPAGVVASDAPPHRTPLTDVDQDKSGNKNQTPTPAATGGSRSERGGAATIAAGSPRPYVSFTRQQTGEVKTVKVGWSWTCFFFSGLFGIPLFMRGLPDWGGVMVGTALLQLLAPQPWSSLFWVVSACLSIFLGIRANEMTAKHYLRQGWVFADPESAVTRMATAKWRFAESPPTTV